MIYYSVSKGKHASQELILSHTASMVMLKLIPAAPINIRGRRPDFSIKKTAIQEARKYSRQAMSALSTSGQPYNTTYLFRLQLLRYAMSKDPA